MSTTEPLAVRGETRHAASDAPPGWLLRAFPSSSQTNVVLRAAVLTAAILGVEYLVEVVWLDLDYWGRWGFLADPGVPLSALGLVFTLVLLGQWGERYVELWTEVRPAFDVTGERYDVVVGRNLRALYGRDYVPFLLFVGVQVGVYRLFPGALPAGYLHVGFLHFFAVTALYCLYRHVVTVARVTNLGVVDVARARPTLSEVADFGVVVGLTWFAALAPLLVYVGFFLLPGVPGLDRVSLAELTLDIGSFYALVGLSLVAVGLLAFLVPVVLLHGALATEKHDRLRIIEDDYDALFAAWREEDLERDPSVGLDILEKRRRNARERSTWPYRLASVGQLALGSVVPVALSVARALGLAG
jgi:hypothetical protein